MVNNKLKFAYTKANYLFWQTRNLKYNYQISYILDNVSLYLENQRYNPLLKPLNIIGLMLSNKANGLKPSAVIRYPNKQCITNVRQPHAISASYRINNQSSNSFAGVGLKKGVELESHYVGGDIQTPPHTYTPPADVKGVWSRLLKESLDALKGVGVGKRQAVYIRAYIKFLHLWGNTPPRSVAPHPYKMGMKAPINEVSKLIMLSM